MEGYVACLKFGRLNQPLVSEGSQKKVHTAGWLAGCVCVWGREREGGGGGGGFG